MVSRFAIRRFGRSANPLAQSVTAGILIQAALAASGPLLARMLGPDGRGQLAAIMIWPAALTYFGSLGLPAATTYAIARGNGGPRELTRSLLKYSLPQLVVLAGVQTVVFVAVLGDRGREVHEAGLVALGLVPALLFQQYGIALLQGSQRFKLFNLARVLPPLLYAILVAVLFVLGWHSLTLVVLVWLGANSATTAFCLVAALVSDDPIRDDPPMRDREMLSFGLRGLFVSGSPVEAVKIDQMALAIFLPAAALGTYVVGLAITNLPSFVSKSVGVVAFPTIAAERETENAWRRTVRYTLLDLVFSLVIVIPLLASARWLIPLLFGGDFAGAVTIAYIILPGTVFLSVRRVLAEGLRGLGRPGIGTVAEIVALGWLVVTLALFVPLLGVRGAAAAMTSAYAVSLLVTLAGAARVRRSLQPTRSASPATVPAPTATVTAP